MINLLWVLGAIIDILRGVNNDDLSDQFKIGVYTMRYDVPIHPIPIGSIIKYNVREYGYFMEMDKRKEQLPLLKLVRLLTLQSMMTEQFIILQYQVLIVHLTNILWAIAQILFGLKMWRVFIMTIKDLDTETLNLLNKLCNNRYIKACPSWLTHFMDKDCQDCQLRELCYLLDHYDNDIRKELALRNQE